MPALAPYLSIYVPIKCLVIHEDYVSLQLDESTGQENVFCPYGLKTWRTGQAIAKAAKAKSYPVLSSPKHNRFSKTAPTSCTRTCSQGLMATDLFQESNSSTFFCDCKITTFPISTIYPPIQLSTFNNGTYSLRSTSLKHAFILKNVKCKAFRLF